MVWLTARAAMVDRRCRADSMTCRARGEVNVATLRLLEGTSPERHEGEVYSCGYTPDGALVLSAGWDGTLRLWDAATGELGMTLPASPKPLSCCACMPDGQQWLSG